MLLAVLRIRKYKWFTFYLFKIVIILVFRFLLRSLAVKNGWRASGVVHTTVRETMFCIDCLITSNVQFFMTPSAFKAEVSSELVSTRKIHNKSHAGWEQTAFFFLRKADECDRFDSRTECF